MIWNLECQGKLARHNVDLIVVQEVRWGRGGKEPQYNYTLEEGGDRMMVSTYGVRSVGSEGEGVNDRILFAVPELKQLVAGLAPWRPRFIFMALHMGFSPCVHTLVFPLLSSTSAAFSYFNLSSKIYNLNN
jgi:hypothetical protein